MNAALDEDTFAPPEEYSIHDVLISPLSADHCDHRRVLGAARHGRDTALACVRTTSQLLRSAASPEEAIDTDMVYDVGRMVAFLTDIVDALTTLESHASYQWERIDTDASPLGA
ncbi:hypothetical protein [Tahibacter amnicola]|uniref:Uncharacterized protein n=1 Tax=Tahibacter amnicola TaxID=2976241 RepID=A0ABY6BKA3_9GAMM|nr:hypothetical protein [Tahibacter amnicola]UXI70448.1 hypothetical protein N4264_12670 [Tahibacter amnicola]